MPKKIQRSETFKECFSAENLKEAYYFARKNIEADNLNILPIWAGAIDIIEENKDEFFKVLSETICKTWEYTPDPCAILFARKDTTFWVRPIAVLSFIDRLIYQSIVNQSILWDTIDETLFSCVYANRINREKKHYTEKNHFLQDYKNNYFLYLETIRKYHNEWFIHLAKMDIQGFYENINIDILWSCLMEDFEVDQDIKNVLIQLLKSWSEFKDSNCGLPQWPDPSAILWNAYLHALDKEVLNSYQGKVQYFRYNDDIILLSKEENDLYKCMDLIIDFLRKRNLRTNAKSWLYPFATKQILEKVITQISGDSLPSTVKLNIRKEKILQIFDAIKNNTPPDLSLKSYLHYYLSKWFDFENKFDTDHLKEFVSLFAKYPLAMEKLLIFFLTPWIVDWEIVTPIDNEEVYSAIFEIYKNWYGNDWQKFNILKLLTLSTISRWETPVALEFTKYISEEFEKSNSVYFQILYIRFFFEEKSKNIDFDDPQYKDDLFKKYLQNLKKNKYIPAISGSILWIYRHRPDSVSSVINHFTQSESYDLQIMAYYYLKLLGKKTQNEKNYWPLLKNLLKINTTEEEEEERKEDQKEWTVIISNTVILNQKNIFIKLEKQKKEDENIKKADGIKFECWKLKFRVDGTDLKIENKTDPAKNTAINISRSLLAKIILKLFEIKIPSIKIQELIEKMWENKKELDFEKSIKDTISRFESSNLTKLWITKEDRESIIKLSEKVIYSWEFTE